MASGGGPVVAISLLPASSTSRVVMASTGFKRRIPPVCKDAESIIGWKPVMKDVKSQCRGETKQALQGATSWRGCFVDEEPLKVTGQLSSPHQHLRLQRKDVTDCGNWDGFESTPRFRLLSMDSCDSQLLPRVEPT